MIRSDPEAGKTLKPGTAVDLIVSKGRQPIKVKDWTGKDADEATEALTGKGLEVEVVGEEYDDTVPEGHVLTQTPTSGTLFRGERVELTVSLGPELVAVPDGLVAMGVDAARAPRGGRVRGRRRGGLGLHRPRLRHGGRPRLGHDAAQGLDGHDLPRLTAYRGDMAGSARKWLRFLLRWCHHRLRGGRDGRHRLRARRLDRRQGGAMWGLVAGAMAIPGMLLGIALATHASDSLRRPAQRGSTGLRAERR